MSFSSLVCAYPLHIFPINNLNFFLGDICVISLNWIFRCDEQFVFSIWYTFNHLLYGLFSFWITNLWISLILSDWNLYCVDIYDDLISRRVNSSDAEKFAEVCPCCNGLGWGVIWWVLPYGNMLECKREFFLDWML